MCIIIFKPEDIELKEHAIKNSFDNNPDGAGFSYVENGEIHTQKGLFTLAEFKEAYAPHTMKRALLHFRIKTHGDLSAENCHPFIVSPKLVMAHNGIITKVKVDTKHSDTWMYNELILKNIVRVYGKKFVFDPVGREVLAAGIGWSKMVFMDNQGRVSILNEDEGNWNSNCWFSNTTYQFEKPNYSYTPPKPPKTKWKKKGKEWEQVDNSSQVIPFPHREEPYRPIQMGDYVRVIGDRLNIPNKTLGKVMGVYANHDAEVYFPLLQRVVRMSIIYLEREIPRQLPPPTDYTGME